MKKLFSLCFFVFLIPALGCVGSANIEHVLLANLSEVTAQTDEEALGTVVFTLLEATTGAEIDTVVDGEGAGVIRYGFGYEPSVIERSQSDLPPDFLSALNCQRATQLLLESAPEGAILTEETRGSAIWCIISAPFSNLSQLTDHYRAILNLSPQSNSPEGNNPQDNSQEGNKREADNPKPQPLIDIQCLEMVDGLFYQDLVLNQSAIQPDDGELLDIFGIELKWRLSIPGDIRSHNAPAEITFPLAWNLLNSPEGLAVNMKTGDACPSARVKLLLEFTNTDTALATLTIPISRNANDYRENEAVRRQLTQQGWLSQIEGSANHAPQIVALRRFDRGDLAKILSAVPGVGSSVNVANSIDIDLDLQGFSDTWAALMPTNTPIAFEFAINSIQPMHNVAGQWSDPTLPLLLWNGPDDDTRHTLTFALTSDEFIAIAGPDTTGSDTTGSDTTGSDTTGSDTTGSDTTGSDTTGSDTTGSDTTGSDTTSSDTIGSDTFGDDDASEIALSPIGSSVNASTTEPYTTELVTAERIQPLSVRVTAQSRSKATTSVADLLKDKPTQTPTDAPASTGASTSPEKAIVAERAIAALASTLQISNTVDSALADSALADSALVDSALVDSALADSALADASSIDGTISEIQPTADNRSALTSAAITRSAVTISTFGEADRQAQAGGALIQSAPDVSTDDPQPAMRISDPVADITTEERGIEDAEGPEILTTSLPECMVVIEWLNLRPGPGPSYGAPIDKLPQETALLVVGQDTYSSWVEVIVKGALTRGWVSRSPEFVACEGALIDVPIVDVTTLPIIGTQTAGEVTTEEESINVSTTGPETITAAEEALEAPEVKPLTSKK